MKKMNLLNKAEMKKVLGGVAMPDVCANKTGLSLKECRYQMCMEGWVKSDHSDTANQNKQDSCYKMSGLPG